MFVMFAGSERKRVPPTARTAAMLSDGCDHAIPRSGSLVAAMMPLLRPAPRATSASSAHAMHAWPISAGCDAAVSRRSLFCAAACDVPVDHKPLFAGGPGDGRLRARRGGLILWWLAAIAPQRSEDLWEIRNGLEDTEDCRSASRHGNQHVRLRGAQVSLFNALCPVPGAASLSST